MNLSKLRNLYCFSLDHDDKSLVQTNRTKALHWLMLAPGRGKSQLLINWCRRGRVDLLKDLEALTKEKFTQLVQQPAYAGISTKEELLRHLVSSVGKKGYSPLIAAARGGKDGVLHALLRMVR